MMEPEVQQEKALISVSSQSLSKCPETSSQLLDHREEKKAKTKPEKGEFQS